MSVPLKTRLINRRHVKDYALVAAGERTHRFTRGGAEFFVKAEAHLKVFIRSYVRSLPSKGKTIQ
jgi:hypothetical protein